MGMGIFGLAASLPDPVALEKIRTPLYWRCEHLQVAVVMLVGLHL